MASAYVFVIDGYTFPRADIPARGPVVESSEQRWTEQDVLGAADPGTILTFIGTRSQKWEYVSRAATATKDKLKAVYEGKVAVNFQTPQNGSGFNVIMTRFRVQYETSIEDGKWLCSFTLVRR